MATKLLLVEDVLNLGRSGDIVSVKGGYARNFLLPNKLALIADSNALRRQAALQEARKQKAIVDKKDSEELAKKLENVVILAEVKVDPEGHMYGSVGAQNIVELLEQQHQYQLDKHFIQLKHPIRARGIHTIELKLKEGIQGKITLKIFAEGTSPDDLEAIAAIEAAKAEEIPVIQEIPAEE